MGLVNFMLVPWPVILVFIGMWQSTRALDNTPENDFNKTRFYLRMNLLMLVVALALLGSTIYNLPRMLELIQLICQ